MLNPGLLNSLGHRIIFPMIHLEYGCLEKPQGVLSLVKKEISICFKGRAEEKG